jgi:uncharacterized protein (DUF2336 family)
MNTVHIERWHPVYVFELGVFLVSSDFRHIAIRNEAGKAERLFRAAVTAFCSLTRPSRREIAQLEDLTLPLFEGVSPESLRFVAAALSECDYPPTELVRRLCEEGINIAAPLLMRSTALTDIDLIALIGRHGLPYAKAIACRNGLHPTIAQLIRALMKPVISTIAEQTTSAEKSAAEKKQPGQAAENVRQQLRALIERGRGVQIANTNQQGGTDIFVRLREAALIGNAPLLQSVLADALEIGTVSARTLTEALDYRELYTALRAVNLTEEQAFLVTASVYPECFNVSEDIRTFLNGYRELDPIAARETIHRWRKETTSQAIIGAHKAAANSDGTIPLAGRGVAFKAT